jgi:hypothetical protein
MQRIMNDISMKTDQAKLDQKCNQNELKASIQALEGKLHLQRISFFKLLSDFSFNYVDVRGLSGKNADGAQAATGLLSAIIATYKILKKCS